MSSTKYIEAEVEVTVDLDNWTTDELIWELQRREAEHVPASRNALWDDLYVAVATHDAHTRDRLLRELIYTHTGRMLP